MSETRHSLSSSLSSSSSEAPWGCIGCCSREPRTIPRARAAAWHSSSVLLMAVEASGVAGNGPMAKAMPSAQTSFLGEAAAPVPRAEEHQGRQGPIKFLYFFLSFFKFFHSKIYTSSPPPLLSCSATQPPPSQSLLERGQGTLTCGKSKALLAISRPRKVCIQID